MFAGGLASGMAAMDYFYPGRAQVEGKTTAPNVIMDSLDNAITEGAAAADIAYDNRPEKDVQGDNKPDREETTASMDGGQPSAVPTAYEEPEAVEVALNDGNAINADTVYMIQEYSRDSGEVTEEVISVPETFIGMNRDLFTKTMEEFATFPSLTELEKGFIGCEVISFSPQRVVVRKIYEQKEMPEGYYLVNENNLVTVYYGDKETVYMNTNIMLQRLPEELKQEIIYVKYVEREEELYDFLEAYSS